MRTSDIELIKTLIKRIVDAYDCGEAELPGDRCEHCEYGYGYLDDSGDHSFWWCDIDKLEEDAIDVLRFILREI